MVERFIEKPNLPRQPRGTRAGGRFAQRKEVISEPSVDLGAELAELDGSKVAEELARKREEAITAAAKKVSNVETPRDEAAILEGMEASLRGNLSDDHFFESDASRFAPEQKPAIQLGGRLEMAGGSWQYPPSYSDVEQIVDHWARCILHDSALANVQNADRYGRDLTVYEAELEQWKRSQPTLTSRFIRKHPEETAAVQAEWKARKQYIDRIRYGIGLIELENLRDVTRLHAIWLQTFKMSSQVQTEVALREFVMTSGEVTTILDVEKKYRLSEISSAWFNREKFRSEE